MPGKRGGITLKELQAKAKAAKVKGWSKMSKAELMQRVGGGGGGGSRATTPTKKRPVTTAKRYEATKVAGAIADKLAKKTGVSDPAEKDAMQHRLLTSVKKAVTQARKTPGATDQDVRKAAAQAVKAEVMAIRGAAGKKQLKSVKADAVEPKKKRSTRSKSKPTTPVNDEAKRRAEIEAKNRARTEALRAKHGDASQRLERYRRGDLPTKIDEALDRGTRKRIDYENQKAAERMGATGSRDKSATTFDHIDNVRDTGQKKRNLRQSLTLSAAERVRDAEDKAQGRKVVTGETASMVQRKLAKRARKGKSSSARLPGMGVIDGKDYRPTGLGALGKPQKHKQSGAKSTSRKKNN